MQRREMTEIKIIEIILLVNSVLVGFMLGVLFCGWVKGME